MIRRSIAFAIIFLVAAAVLAGAYFALCACFGVSPAQAHDIYTDVHGRNGQLCCGGNDCAATIYRERGGAFEFLTREKEWIAIPSDRITWLPIPGDPPSDDTHRAHLCYRQAQPYELSRDSVFGNIFLYCAFIPPGST
jgi:hypothetical protein